MDKILCHSQVNFYIFSIVLKMEHDYANYFGRVRSHPNRRRLSLGGNGQFYYQNQDFFSTTINESSGGEDQHNLQNREDHLSNSTRAFPASFNFPQSRPPELEFSSQSSRECDQDFTLQANVIRKVSLTQAQI